VLFAGTLQGHLLVSRDAGIHWRHLWQLPGGVLALAVAAEGRLLHAGTNHGLVWRSTDGGRHWQQVNTHWAQTTRVPALAVEPQHPATVYAGTDNGLFRTLSGGRHWTRLVMPRPLPTPRHRAIEPVFSLAVAAHAPPAVWAGTWRPRTQGPHAAGPALYRSSDGGLTWTPGVLGVPASGSGIYVLALASPAMQPRVLYVGTQSGVYTLRETSPQTWARRGAILLAGQAVYALAVSPDAAQTLYMGTANGLSVARGGRPPALGRLVPADRRRVGVRVICVDPLHPQWAYAATDKGLLRTTDSGAHWTYWTCPLTACTGADVTSLAVAVTAPH
jgi:photosystem II stability/assembly factor-like uncharacterized protein